MHEKSKKAAVLTAIDVLKKCNFSPCKMEDTAARFMACAVENNIDISEQLEPPTETETVVTPRPVAAFMPLSPGERHAAAITPGNDTPPLMVVIWLYIAILQKHLFSVSHTLERCHVPVYGFTRLLYTAAALLLYHVNFSGLLSGLPLLDTPKIRRDPVYTVPCKAFRLSGFTSLRVLSDIETVSGLTRLTGCRTCYHDTS